MKVYILISGMCNDCQIEGVFSNREAAENYAKLVSDIDKIKERKVYDHIGKVFSVVNLWTQFDKAGTVIQKGLSVRKRSMNDSLEEINKTIFLEKIQFLIISRSVNKEELLDEELTHLKEKYGKIMKELYIQIRILMEKGWTEERINEWLENKTKKGEI